MADRSHGLRDRWLWVSTLIAAAAYVALPFLRPTGENWGRGWNLVAFWFYSAPVVVIAGIVMCWRLLRAESRSGAAAFLLPAVAFLYPLVAYFAIRAK